MVSEHHVVDITIIGAGPTGLAAAYYAGHRDASVRIVESLGQLGGQVAAVYPEKHVYDVAGHPKIQGQELVDLCVEQGLQFGAEVFLDQEAKTLQRVGVNGEEHLVLTTAKGGPFLSRELIVTAGHGAFEPRKLEIEDIDEWEGSGLHYFVRRKEVFSDKACVIVGGGDSALDWTLGLQDTARLPSRSSTGATASARSRRPSRRRASWRTGRASGSDSRTRCAACTGRRDPGGLARGHDHR